MPDARLEVTDAIGRRVVVHDKPTFTIGRRSANDLQLTGTDVSRDHAEILCADGRYLVRERGELEPKLARARGQVPVAAARFDTSRKIPEQVFATGKELVIADLPEGNLADAHLATIAHGIRHVLCVPLLLVRYVDRPGDPL